MGKIGALIESVELDLLGRTRLSFDRWAQRSGWTPEELNASCWRCAGTVGAHEQNGEGCAGCRRTRLPWDRALRLGAYEGELRGEVLALKFQRWRPGGHGLGMLMGRRIRTLADAAQIPTDAIRIVPVPTHRVRRITRGIDHTMTLARGACEGSGIRVVRALRANLRPEQVGLSATARARNIRHAFAASSRKLTQTDRGSGEDRENSPCGVRVWVLIDDVRTTGATLTAASRALRRGLKARGIKRGAYEIWVGSVCVATGRDRRASA